MRARVEKVDVLGWNKSYVNATSRGLVIIQRRDAYRTREKLVTRVLVDFQL